MTFNFWFRDVLNLRLGLTGVEEEHPMVKVFLLGLGFQGMQCDYLEVNDFDR